MYGRLSKYLDRLQVSKNKKLKKTAQKTKSKNLAFQTSQHQILN